MNIDVKILGIPELQRTFKKLAEKTQRSIVRPAIDRTVKNVMLPEAISRAPVDKGTLVASLIVVKSKKRGFVGANVSTRGKPGVADAAFHAGPLEYGTKHAAAQPFLRPAFEATQNDATSQISSEIAKGIEQEAK